MPCLRNVGLFLSFSFRQSLTILSRQLVKDFLKYQLNLLYWIHKMLFAGQPVLIRVCKKRCVEWIHLVAIKQLNKHSRLHVVCLTNNFHIMNNMFQPLAEIKQLKVTCVGKMPGPDLLKSKTNFCPCTLNNNLTWILNTDKFRIFSHPDL